MQRWTIGAVAALPFLLSPAAADPISGSADSIRVCDKTSGCRYVERAAAGKQAARKQRTVKVARTATETAANTLAFGSVAASFGATPWVAEARRYKGMTGADLGVTHRGLWCGEFMGRVARATGLKTPANPNMAPNWASAGTRISSPRVGAIALVHRGGGIGHVGIVTGVNGNGDPILISGNHKNRVVETAYPRGRIAAYVWPQS